RALDVSLELIAAVHGGERGYRDETAVALGEAGALPHVAVDHFLAQVDELGDGAANLVSCRRCRCGCGHDLSPVLGSPTSPPVNSGLASSLEANASARTAPSPPPGRGFRTSPLSLRGGRGPGAGGGFLRAAQAILTMPGTPVSNRSANCGAWPDTTNIALPDD